MFVVCCAVLCPPGVVPFIQDLTSSLKSSGIECEVPPIVYEQVGGLAGCLSPPLACL
jgi:hypothetical protein